MKSNKFPARLNNILESISVLSISILFISGAYSKRAVKVSLGIAFVSWLLRKIIIHRREFLKNLAPKKKLKK